MHPPGEPVDDPGPPFSAGSALGSVLSSALLGAFLFVVGFVFSVLVVLGVLLALADRRGDVDAPSLWVGVVFALVTLAVSFGAAYVVGRRLPEPPAGDWTGLLVAAATPVACYLLLVLVSIDGAPDAVATELQAAGLLGGSGLGAWLGQAGAGDRRRRAP